MMHTISRGLVKMQFSHILFLGLLLPSTQIMVHESLLGAAYKHGLLYIWGVCKARLKLAIKRAFTPQKLANITNQSFFFLTVG